MEENILEKAVNVHMTGIGGTGMSGLACLLHNEGKLVTGSDNNLSDAVAGLKKNGINVFTSHEGKNVSEKAELLIHSHAVLPDNPEIIKAVSLGIPVISYPQAVGRVLEKRRGIAVSGTHGKTTTSAIVVSIMQSAQKKPSFLIGGEIRGVGNSGVGSGEFLIVEACEFKSSFFYYSPEVAILTNIEKDHLDYYKSLGDIKNAFARFLGNLKEGGTIIYCSDDKNAREVVGRKAGKKISYGIECGDWRAENISCANGYTTYDCIYRDKKAGAVKIKIYGLHNVVNSLAGVAACTCLGLSFQDVSRAIYDFPGVRRRCEVLGQVKGVTVIDDYGHHPTEIKATLTCIRQNYKKSRLIVVFQPHQYSRTRFMLKDFAGSFGMADKIVVPDIYFVRDSLEEKKLVDSKILVEKIKENGQDAVYLPEFRDIVEYLFSATKPGDVVLTLGAGPIDGVAKRLLAGLKDTE